MENLAVLDCEIYPNYSLFSFQNLENGKIVSIEIKGENSRLSIEDAARLKAIMVRRTTFGFNSVNYDLPIIFYAIKGATCRKLQDMSSFIINENSRGWQTMKRFGISIPEQVKHFDLQEIAPGVRVSLKLYGARLHAKYLQDLPIEPETMLTPAQMEITKLYCNNDLSTTVQLFEKIKDRIKLRYDMSDLYGKKIISKSDAQMAEVVITHELKKLNGQKRLKAVEMRKGTKFYYSVPHYIEFKTPDMQNALNIIRENPFELDAKGSIKLPAKLKKLKIHLGDSIYQLGIGGIHTQEKKQCIIPNKYQILADRDVAAYYPTIILNLGLFPKHLGPMFLKVYKKIVEDRLKAKKEGNKVINESLKIVINGSFGKFGNKYSALYSPDLMMAVTITGQLSLMMLIEKLEDNGISVVSANTDGFVSLMPKTKYDLFDQICSDWEIDTGFELEETLYKALYSRDVNNYFAITENKTKGKGIFTDDDIGKNPQAPICIEAVKKLLTDGTPIANTIKSCDDVRKFLTVRSVTGGAIWKDEYLGRVVRWIYSKEGAPIIYKKPNKKGNFNKVALSDGARPIMELGDFPEDIDYKKYIIIANDILDDIGLTDI